MLFEYEKNYEKQTVENPPLEFIMRQLNDITIRGNSYFILTNDLGDFIQCAGAKLRLTIEYKNKLGGTHYILGLENNNREPISINFSGGPIVIKKNEVLNIKHAINLFSSFYRKEEIPKKYVLRLFQQE
ncbi:hypothetical protein [Cytobacillus sp. IB215316]|uniref:hypothetical protein n=1 Tax=Cytobacillus sp. IB215316 TaxID=3097354 RepID=UPI002A107DD2|nr:hypothetical protein [Cytobacillus sp. IB215316]MDX8363441.1 hypothetical protein [Cytobacillus sp. IB215316]